MLAKLKSLFKKKEKTVFDIKKYEETYPVDTWYTSGSHQVLRLSNVYMRGDVPFITVEKPELEPLKNEFQIVKLDDLAPSYLRGWNKVDDKEQKKLEKSYWKAIENQLKKQTVSNKAAYNNFVKLGK